MTAETALALAERILYDYAASVDGEFGCCHSAAELRLGGRAPSFDGDEFEPLPGSCAAQGVLDEWLPQIADLRTPPGPVL